MASWLDDGSNSIKATAGSASFQVEGVAAGSPANALYDRALAQGQYFEIKVLDLKESCFVGITTKVGFGKGYMCKGLLFGRNLSDGGALVRGDYGPQIAAGQKIGVLSEWEDAKVTVTFYQDGRCLGPAFVAERPLLDGGGRADVYPLVHTSSNGDSFEIHFPDVPAERQRQGPDGKGRHPAEGCWSMKDLFTGPELGQVPLAEKMEGRPVTLKVESVGGGDFKFSFRVANTLGMTAHSEPAGNLAPFDKLTPGRVISTLMMPPPGMAQVETIVSNGLESLHKWLVQPDMLMLTGATCEMSFEPSADSPESLPATEVALK